MHYPRNISSIVLILLSLTALVMISGSVRRVYAFNQSGPTSWSPVGPQEGSLLFTVYGSAANEMSVFENGLTDIPDAPVPTSLLTTFGSNPDFYLTSPVAGSSYVALNGWNWQQCNGSTCVNTQSSLVSTTTGGFSAGQGYWSFLNMRPVPGYDPCSFLNAPVNCSSFQPGGGTPNLIRRALAQGTDNLNPFQPMTLEDQDVFSSIFDSMLTQNPENPSQLIDWLTVEHNPAQTSCTVGDTCQFWRLKNDLNFQDGNRLSANDVAYSINAYNVFTSSQFHADAASVLSATPLDCGPGQPCRTLKVMLAGTTSSVFELDIGSLPILEKALWAPYCGDPPVANSSCGNTSFDPMYPSANSPGIMVGGGPWACITPTSGIGVSMGHVGGPCSEDVTGALVGQVVVNGGRILLRQYTGYTRCCPSGSAATASSLYKLSYSDAANTGIVQVIDLAFVATVFGGTSSYWVNPNIASGNTVNIQDLATVAFYFDSGLSTPYVRSTGSLPSGEVLQNMLPTGIDPQIDPFFCPNTGC